VINQYNLLSLHILRKARENLIKEFLTEKSEIYIDMFKFENDNMTMSFCIDKYLTIWLDEHWNIINDFFTQNIVSKQDQEITIDYFTNVFIKLLRSFDFSTSNISNTDLLDFLLNQKTEYLDKIIKMSENSEKNINWLIYKSEKSRKLFERQLNEFKNTKL